MEPVIGTVVEHVRLRNAPVDVPVARLRLSYLLSSMDLRPVAMPPSAVLVVRSMRDPLPQRITSEFVSAATPSRAWEVAAQSQMGDLYRRAARPAAGPVPASAASVLFSDYAELLACLALDVDTGASNSWWWKSILRRFSSRGFGGWAEIWADNPRYVPAALQFLDRRGRAVETVECVSSEQAWELLVRVAREFALPEAWFAVLEAHKRPAYSKPEPLFSTEATHGNPFADTISEASQTLEYPERNSIEDSAVAPPPWEPWVTSSSVPASLGIAQRAFMGVSLLLNRALEAASSASFALRFRAWLASEQAREDRQVPAISPAYSGDRPPKPEVRERVPGDDEFPSPSARDPDRADMSALEPPPSAAQLQSNSPTASEPVQAIEAPAQSKSLPTPMEFDTGVRTGLGGIFYLIHLVLQAELLSFNTGLGGWAILDLLARCLLGQSFVLHTNDPVWAALAALDGRDAGTFPGASFKPQKTYEAPGSWLHESEHSRSRYVRFRHGRTEIWRSEGFPIFDSEDPRSSLPDGLLPLTRHRRRRFRSAAEIHPLGMTLTPQLRRFLHFILPYARWRLRSALGTASLNEMMSRTGTLHISRTHLDLVMGMDQIGLPVRLAGLDGNPGWVPQLGRVITFHFIQEGFGNG